MHKTLKMHICMRKSLKMHIYECMKSLRKCICGCMKSLRKCIYRCMKLCECMYRCIKFWRIHIWMLEILSEYEILRIHWFYTRINVWDFVRIWNFEWNLVWNDFLDNDEYMNLSNSIFPFSSFFFIHHFFSFLTSTLWIKCSLCNHWIHFEIEILILYMKMKIIGKSEHLKLKLWISLTSYFATFCLWMFTQIGIWVKIYGRKVLKKTQMALL